MKNKTHCIGIVGGMGPMAGVLLQQKIIELTPAKADQEHLRVICYTNPQIPDRTRSLQEDNGEIFVKEVIASIKVLENAGVDSILIPCNTSHARFDDIAQSVSVPILNMVDIALRKAHALGVRKAGLLATDGTIAAGVFQKKKQPLILLPDPAEQREVMKIIYAIKSGKYNDPTVRSDIRKLSLALRKRGAQKIIFGCTELSLYTKSFPKSQVIDPLEELAKEAIKVATAGR